MKMKQDYLMKGRQLRLRTISKRFKMFWDIRKPYWKGTDEELMDDIFNDPDFQESFRIVFPQGKNQQWITQRFKSIKGEWDETNY
jgi:hypothetical protein